MNIFFSPLFYIRFSLIVDEFLFLVDFQESRMMQQKHKWKNKLNELTRWFSSDFYNFINYFKLESIKKNCVNENE